MIIHYSGLFNLIAVKYINIKLAEKGGRLINATSIGKNKAGQNPVMTCEEFFFKIFFSSPYNAETTFV